MTEYAGRDRYNHQISQLEIYRMNRTRTSFKHVVCRANGPLVLGNQDDVLALMEAPSWRMATKIAVPKHGLPQKAVVWIFGF